MSHRQAVLCLVRSINLPSKATFLTDRVCNKTKVHQTSEVKEEQHRRVIFHPLLYSYIEVTPAKKDLSKLLGSPLITTLA